jgi:hypothetical protein
MNDTCLFKKNVFTEANRTEVGRKVFGGIGTGHRPWGVRFDGEQT